MSTYVITECGGHCPTQALGMTSEGRPFYFRARGGGWALRVGEPGWPLEYVDWPGEGALAGEGSDPSFGYMERPAVEAILGGLLGGAA